MSFEKVPLSKRQLECIRGVAQHLDSQQIGLRLNISPHTVNGHVAAAMRALGVSSRREAVRVLQDRYSHLLTGEVPPVFPGASIDQEGVQPNFVREQRAVFHRPYCLCHLRASALPPPPCLVLARRYDRSHLVLATLTLGEHQATWTSGASVDEFLSDLALAFGLWRANEEEWTPPLYARADAWWRVQ